MSNFNEFRNIIRNQLPPAEWVALKLDYRYPDIDPHSELGKLALRIEQNVVDLRDDMSDNRHDISISGQVSEYKSDGYNFIRHDPTLLMQLKFVGLRNAINRNISNSLEYEASVTSGCAFMLESIEENLMLSQEIKGTLTDLIFTASHFYIKEANLHYQTA